MDFTRSQMISLFIFVGIVKIALLIGIISFSLEWYNKEQKTHYTGNQHSLTEHITQYHKRFGKKLNSD